MLTLSPTAPLHGALTSQLRILDSWSGFLGSARSGPGGRRPAIAVAS
jgi:hypothetical protein